ncbi:YdcF family protein [Prosthecobacter sp. SYSU 5D2]|uniref:YdcF family protein n=1 Tax=Prosthecobacter sp. SYSU 5D2 TaxID=3134134 RepID=UPI0031FE757D
METLLRWFFTLIQPLTLVWLLLGIWVARMVWMRLWRWAALPTLAWLLLTVITCTSLASWLLAGLENRYALPAPADVEGADVIVCLGGGIQPSLTEPMGLHLVRGADRLATALSMAASGMAPILVIGGGGYKQDGQMHSEADAILDFLKRFPDQSFESISLGTCANTRDEALKVAKLARDREWKKVVLVTSASHMPRSVATFAKAGVPVVPVPCHYMSSYNQIGEGSWLHLPYRGSFDLFDSWFHETIGTWIYRWRGWL